MSSLLPPLRRFLQAVRLRCPACGGGPVFLSWLRMCPCCPSCGLNYDREPEGGYWLGAWSLNLFVTECAFATTFVAGVAATWPAPPWDALAWGSVALALGFPVAFYPWSKTLFIAIDITVRPREPADYVPPREPSGRASGRLR